MKFNESYVNPFGHAAVFYYGRNLEKACLKVKTRKYIGQRFNYQSGSTQLLGLLLDRSLKTEQQNGNRLSSRENMDSFANGISCKLDIDKKKDGLEKTFCCINARAIDFKLGNFI